MQDTPNFQNYKNQFNQYTLSDLIDARETVGEPERTYIKEVHDKLSQYFIDNDFRATLGQNRKNSIEGQIGNILSQFETLRQWQRDGTPIAGGNIQNVMANISAYMDEFDLRYSDPHQLYKLQGNTSVDELISEINTQKQSAEVAAAEAQKKLSEAGLLVGKGSSYKLASYYQMLANGRTYTTHNERSRKVRTPISIRNIIFGTIFSAVILFFVSLGAIYLSKIVKLPTEVIVSAVIAAAVPFLIAGILTARNYINNNYPGGYERSSVFWMIGAIISTFATALYAAILVLQLGDNAGWEEIIPKIIGLLAPAYFIRFCVQNYKANKHLVIQNTHRATLATIAKSFSDSIEHENKTFEQDVLRGQIDIIHAAAEVLFLQSETGYLTTKEGAGSGDDNMLDSLNRIRQ